MIYLIMDVLFRGRIVTWTYEKIEVFTLNKCDLEERWPGSYPWRAFLLAIVLFFNNRNDFTNKIFKLFLLYYFIFLGPLFGGTWDCFLTCLIRMSFCRGRMVIWIMT